MRPEDQSADLISREVLGQQEHQALLFASEKTREELSPLSGRHAARLKSKAGLFTQHHWINGSWPCTCLAKDKSHKECWSAQSKNLNSGIFVCLFQFSSLNLWSPNTPLLFSPAPNFLTVSEFATMQSNISLYVWLIGLPII